MARIALLLALALVAGAAAVAAAWPEDDENRQAARPAPLDLRTTLGRPASFLRRFDYEAMYVATYPDRIPAIDEPRLEDPDEADLLHPSSLVVGIELEGEAHAYPTNLLSYHEVVNDVVGGRRVAITWCPLCSTALAYDPRVGDDVLTFGVSGYLYGGNLVLFDRQTGSLWSQLLGGAVTGRYRGTRLRPIPVVHETWQAWRAAHPNTRVLSIEADDFADRFTDPYTEVGFYGEDSSDIPYGAYAAKASTYFPRVVRGLADGSRVLGVSVAGRAKAYPFGILVRTPALSDAVGAVPVLITFDGEAYSASTFSRRAGERLLTFRLTAGGLVDRETGSRWTLGGRAVAGPLAGTTLARLPSTFSYWFAWRRIHPETAIYR